MCSVLEVEISPLHITSDIFFAKIYRGSNFGSCISRNKLGKYTILWFKKRLLFLMGGKDKWIHFIKKLSFSLVDVIFLRTFLLLWISLFDEKLNFALDVFWCNSQFQNLWRHYINCYIAYFFRIRSTIKIKFSQILVYWNDTYF